MKKKNKKITRIILTAIATVMIVLTSIGPIVYADENEHTTTTQKPTEILTIYKELVVEAKTPSKTPETTYSTGVGSKTIICSCVALAAGIGILVVLSKRKTTH